MIKANRKERRAAAGARYTRAAWVQACHFSRRSARALRELVANRGFDYSRDFRAI